MVLALGAKTKQEISKLVLLFLEARVALRGLALMYYIIKLELNLNQTVISVNKPTDSSALHAHLPDSVACSIYTTIN